jgi:hypothetical protein
MGEGEDSCCNPKCNWIGKRLTTHIANNQRCAQYIHQFTQNINNSQPLDDDGMPHGDGESEHNGIADDWVGCEFDAETEVEVMEEQEDVKQPTPRLMHNELAVAEFLLLHLLTKIGAPMYAYEQFREWARYMGRNKVDPYTLRTRAAVIKELAKTFKLQDMKPTMRRAEILRLREVHEQGLKNHNEREKTKAHLLEKEIEKRGAKRSAEGTDDVSREDDEASHDDDGSYQGDGDGDASKKKGRKQSASMDNGNPPIEKTDAYYEEDVHRDFHRVPIDIVTFSVREGLKNLLCERPEVMKPENLVVNEEPAKRFLEYEPSHEYLAEINTGEWYKTAYKKLIRDPTTEFLCPLIIFIDHTAIDFIGRWGLTPVVATCSIFKEKWRRDPNCWIILGFVPDVKHGKSIKQQDRERSKMKNITCINLHTCYEVIFKDLITIQNDGGLWLPLSLDGGKTREWRLVKVPIALVMGDIQGNNQLCGRYVYFGLNQERMCRACDVPPDQCSDHKYQCTFVTAKEVQKANKDGSSEALKKYSLHRVKNVFLKLSLGGCKYGIHGQTPVDVMHTLLEGIIKYILKGFFATFTPLAITEFDIMAVKLNQQSRCYARGQYARVHCGRGVSNVSQVTAKELAGIMLLVALTLMTPGGQQAVSQSYKKKCLDQEEVETKIRDWIYVFEMLACFERWCCKAAYWDRQDETGYKRAMTAIRSLMRNIFRLAPRETGQGWDIEKFHDLLHIPLCILLFGSLRGYDTGSAEKNHKCFAKKPAKLTQKRVATFEKQTADRCFEMLVLSRALNGYARVPGCIPEKCYDKDEKAILNYLTLLDDEDEYMEVDGTATQHHDGATYFLLPKPSDCYSLALSGKARKTIPETLWPRAWSDFLTRHYTPIKIPSTDAERQHNVRVGMREGDSISFISEFNKQGIRYRAHPNYQSQGAWHDWVEMSWEMDDDDDGNMEEDEAVMVDGAAGKVKTCMAPGQVLMFIVWKNRETEAFHYEALVWAATGVSKKNSVLTRKFEMEQTTDSTPFLRIVDADCLGKHVFCFREDRGDKSTGFALQVLPQKEWADQFHTD